MKMFKRTLSVLMAVLILILSAPLDGLIGLDLHIPKISFNSFAVDSNNPNYSSLTPDQYMVKVMLNHNYSGIANDYGNKETTIKQFAKEYYTNRNNVSAALPLYRLCCESESFIGGLAAWKVLTFDPSEAYENLLDEQGYYEAILMSILDAAMNDSIYLDALNCEANKALISLSKSSTTLISELNDVDFKTINLRTMNLSELSNLEVDAIYQDMIDNIETHELCESLGDHLDDFKMIISSCTTIYDLNQTVATYSQLANLTDSVKEVLYSIYLNCPSSNAAMKNACQKVYEIASEQMTNAQIAFIEAKDAFINNAFSYVVGEIWSWAKKEAIAALGSSLLVGMNIGQAIGKTISNFMFSTDEIIEQFFVMESLIQFEQVMDTALAIYEAEFKRTESDASAKKYIQALKMYFSVMDLDYDYTMDFVVISREKGGWNTLKSWFTGKDQTVEDYRKSIQTMKGVMAVTKEELTNIEWSRWDYEVDAPEAYELYFTPVDLGTENPTVYSDTETVKGTVPEVDEVNENFFLYEYEISNDKKVTITKCLPESYGVAEIPKDIDGYAVRTIGTGAFYGCTGITEIVCPSTLRTIGWGAFEACSNLSKVTLNNGLETISGRAFSGTGITSITIPKTIKNLYGSTYYTSASCFYEAEHLKTVVFEYGILSIPYRALYGCSSIKTVTIPNGITEIGEAAFASCTGLTTVSLPSSLATIRESAFWGCTSLTSISFPNALVTIGEGAFYGCTGITEIVCPSTLRTIGWGAFEACSNLSKVTLNNGLETISGRAFSGTGITSITIPKTIKNLYGSTYYTSASCFYEAEHLKTVVFEYGILSIPYRALFGCSSVINIVLPSSVEEIGQYAFYGCSSITDITIDETVTRIDENAFDDCTSLTTFHVVKNSFAHQYAINKGYNVEFIDCTHTKTEIDEDYPATCTESGYQTTICSFCRETIERKTIDPLGHEWTIISVIREATCTYEGYAKVICSRCGLVTENATEKAPHNYVLKSEREATCTRQGIMIYECSVCHEQKEERTEPIGHIDVNNDKLCDVCGTLALGESDVGGQCGDTAYWIFIEPTSTLRIFGTGDLWDYVEPSDGQVHLSGPGAPWNSIEATAYGKAISKVVFDTGITGVGNGIFIGSSVSQIIFSETITKIGYMAFYNCKGLTEVVFPDSVAQIEERAFWSCENLSAITFGNNLKTIGKDAFGLCRALTILNLPSCVEEIGDGAFTYCYLLTSVTLSNSLLSIGKEAFKGCSALQAVQIPAHVYEIGRGAFWNCNAISGFVVDVNNGFYSSDDRGALYNKDKTSLIQYPHGAAYIYNFDVPDTVRTIEERAFEAVNIGCVTMTHVTAIQNKAFVESPLSTLKLSNRIRSIGTDAFHYAWLHTVYFDGTQEQWATVSIAEGNDELQNADFHFTGNGSINYTPGDINGDGVLNNKDLNRLMKFLAGDDVEVVEEALDLNGDGNVNNKDLNRLMKYLAGEDVEIY